MSARIKKTKVNCDICHSAKQDVLYKVKIGREPFKVVKCKCGLMFLNPRPSAQFFDEFYEKKYFRSGENYRDSGQFDLEKETPLGFQRNVELFLSKQSRKKGKYLDVGCASGHYVQIFHDLGWDSTGIDVSEYSTEFARDVRGLNVLTGDVVEAGLPAKKYDIITLLNVVEHLPNPREVLKELERLLKDRGMLVVITPNAGSFVAKLRKDKWWGHDDKGHIHFFSLGSLGRLLDDLGMEIFALDCVYPYGYSLGDVLKRDENRGKKGTRAMEYILMRRVSPVTIKFSRGLTDLLTPGMTCFIRKKQK